MKRLVTFISVMAIFVMSVGFTGNDSKTIQVDPDSTTIANITVSFDDLKVKQEVLPFKQQLEQNTQVTKDLATQMETLNSKVPDMTTDPYEATLSALDERFDITEEQANKAFMLNGRLTNLTNLLVFVGGVGIFAWLFNNKRSQRQPDVVLKIGTVFAAVALLAVMRLSMVAFMTGLFNPTYRVIEQFITLGG